MAKFWRKVRKIRDSLLGTLTNGLTEEAALKIIRNTIIAELAPEIEAAVNNIINSSSVIPEVKEMLIDHAEDKLRALFADWADDGKINDSEEVTDTMEIDKGTDTAKAAADAPDDDEPQDVPEVPTDKETPNAEIAADRRDHVKPDGESMTPAGDDTKK